MNVDILVIGGGISGLTAAVEAAETGYSVAIVEKNPYLGGRVTQLTRYFPKMCPPYCGLEILLKRLKNCEIEVITNAKVKRVEGVSGNFNVFVEKIPRFVNERCTACGECEKVCPIERLNDFDFGLSKTKAIYMPHDMAYPPYYVIDGKACNKCGECVKVCKYDAIDLEDQPGEMTISAKAIIVATGFNPYDAKKLETLGFGVYENVITNMMMERLASPNGPTKGKILIDGREPKVIAFAQCAGSRDENHLPYCSAICCLATMKHALYVREKIPDSKVYIFYIDVRAYGRYEDFLQRVQQDENIVFVKGKVAKVEGRDGKVVVHAEDTSTGKKVEMEVDLLVLAVGMQPSTVVEKIEGLEYDNYGFVIEKDGIIPCGVARMPADVATSNRDATGAVIKAIQVVKAER